MDTIKQLDEFAPGRFALKTIIPTDELGARAYIKKRENGKGFTKGKNFRHIADIPLAEIVALGEAGCVDAQAAALGDDAALKRLILKHPEWRVCEGGI